MKAVRLMFVTAAVAAPLVASGAWASDRGGPMGSGRSPHRPPPVAVEACNAAQPDDPCAFTGRFGEEVSGTCVVFQDDTIACLPDHPPPDLRSMQPGMDDAPSARGR
jgi:hypothetical protein